MSFSDWVFDLDNTLYPASCSLFPQIDERMTRFVADWLKLGREEARQLQKRYYRDFGTTLRGLMTLHGVPPDEFLEFAHDIDHSVLAPAPRLAAAIKGLPGRKFVFTNGSARHAEKVLERLGMTELFDGTFDIKAADYLPKPAIDTYRRMLTVFAIEPTRSVMFEDLARNLTAAAELGMTTVWVRHPDHSFAEGTDPLDLSAIHHITEDLALWLEERMQTHG